MIPSQVRNVNTTGGATSLAASTTTTAPAASASPASATSSVLESVDSVNTRIVVIKICYCLPFSLKDLYSSNCCLTRLDHKSELLFPTQGTQVAQHFSILHVRHSRRMTLLRFESDRSTFSTYSNTLLWRRSSRRHHTLAFDRLPLLWTRSALSWSLWSRLSRSLRRPWLAIGWFFRHCFRLARSRVFRLHDAHNLVSELLEQSTLERFCREIRDHVARGTPHTPRLD